MSNAKHETITDIVAEMRSNEFDDPSFNVYSLVAARTLARGWADRIEAAHQREVAELRECLKETMADAVAELAEVNRKRFEAKRLGKEQPEPTEQQLKNRFYAKRWRANQKARAALAKAGGEE